MLNSILSKKHFQVYVHEFCPNQTEHAWRHIDLWSLKSGFAIGGENGVLRKCPHPLYNQTLIVGWWIWDQE